jgi:hypothetical protein
VFMSEELARLKVRAEIVAPRAIRQGRSDVAEEQGAY